MSSTLSASAQARSPSAHSWRLKCRALAFCLLSSVVVAQARSVGLERTVTFDIPAQPLDAALRAFSMQANIQLVIAPNAATGATAPTLSGRLQAGAALTELLGASGLKFEAVGDTVTVAPATSKSGAALRLARAAAEGDPGSGGGPANSRSTGAMDGPGVDSSDGTGENRKLQEIVITGTHIHDDQPSATPITTITSAEIVKSGAATLQDVFATQTQALSELSGTSGLGASGLSSLDNFNYAGASAVSLRGLGPQSTLTLVNGERRAGNVNGRVVDISAIPVSLVDHIDLLTGGNSAVYGSDAIAGVANIILRRDFNGAETTLSGTDPDVPGGSRYQFAQLFGRTFDQGGFVTAVDYEKTAPMDVVRTSIPILPGPGGIIPLNVDVQPNSHQITFYGAGHYRLTPNATLYADASYSDSYTQYFGNAGIPSEEYEGDTDTRATSRQTNADAGISITLPAHWGLDASADYSLVSNDEAAYNTYIFDGASTPYDYVGQNRSTLLSGRAVANGPLFSVLHREVNAAFGLEVRHETQAGISLSSGTNAAEQTRKVYSTFGELHVPLTPDRALELSTAIRYDHYSDVGSTTNPQMGLVWRILNDQFNARATYGRSFRAPDLFSRNNLSSSVEFESLADPLAAKGSSVVLLRQGDNTNLRPETAHTWNVGFDARPQITPWLSVSVDYFETTYSNRIDTPASGAAVLAVLENEGVYGALLNRHPAAADIASLLSNAVYFSNRTGTPYNPLTQDAAEVFPGLVLFNNQLANIAVETVKGLDLKVHEEWALDRGVLSADASGTHYFTFYEQLLPGEPRTAAMDTPGRPTRTRVRASVAWQQGWLTTTGYANYASSYEDPFVVPTRRVASWTTLDASIQGNLSQLDLGSVLSRMAVTLSVRNITGSRPPAVYSNAFGLGYDGANANPFGRIIGLQARVMW